jgi:hypothetical protein
MDRDASLINSFQVLCALEPPTFNRIDQKASAMRLAVHKDLGQSQATGQFAHSKSWIVNLTDGPHELVATEANGPNLHIVSCGISAPDPNGAAFKKELVLEMKLGQASSEAVSPDGVLRLTTWTDVFGKGTLLRLIDATPQGKPGAITMSSECQDRKTDDWVHGSNRLCVLAGSDLSAGRRGSL